MKTLLTTILLAAMLFGAGFIYQGITHKSVFSTTRKTESTVCVKYPGEELSCKTITKTVNNWSK